MAAAMRPPMGAGAGEDYQRFGPQPVAGGGRAAYRDGKPMNLMHDKRVRRGNTWAAHTLPAAAEIDPEELAKQQEARKRRLARQRARAAERQRAMTPPPVENRQHRDVQTEQFLEELTDKVPEADVHTQTDPFLERAPSPVFVPTKTGTDAETQVYPGDLFDFDAEVAPLLDVLVGKTLEQALLEVLEDAELEAMRARQREFEHRRNVELAETQRMEERERRLVEEKERRLAQERERQARERAVKEKVAARGFAQQYLGGLVASAFGNLKESGFFYDTVAREVETDFMPWALARVDAGIERRHVARRLLDNMIHASLRRDVNAQLRRRRAERDAEMARRAAVLAEWESECARLAAEHARAVAAAAGDGDEDGDGDGDADGSDAKSDEA